MAATSNTTLLSDLLDPQVVADYIDKKLIDGIRFAPLARIDTTLVGRPGDEVTLPFYKYISPAEAVSEGQDIPISKLTQDKTKVKVSKIGRAVQFTDEALLSAYNNDIAEEAASQVVMAISDKVEIDLLAQMSTKSVLDATIDLSKPVDGVADALAEFGEDIDGQKVLLCDPKLYTALVKSDGWIPNTETGADILIRGSVGQVLGNQIALTNRLKGTGTAYIVKPGALALYMKRDTLVEFDRDKIDQTNYIIGSKIFAPYVYDTSKIIKITVNGSVSA